MSWSETGWIRCRTTYSFTNRRARSSTSISRLRHLSGWLFLSKSYFHVYRFSNLLNIVEMKGRSGWIFSSKKTKQTKLDWRGGRGRSLLQSPQTDVQCTECESNGCLAVWFPLLWFTIKFANDSRFKRFSIQTILDSINSIISIQMCVNNSEITASKQNTVSDSFLTWYFF